MHLTMHLTLVFFQANSLAFATSSRDTGVLMVDTALEQRVGPGPATRGPWLRASARFGRQRIAVAALALLVVLFGAGALAGVIAPYSFSAINVNQLSRPPSAHHFFGTDLLGRDHFSRTLYAVRTSETVALSVAAAGTLIGIVIVALGGYYGRWLDAVLMRVVDFTVALPVLAVLSTAIVFFGAPTPRKIGTVLAVVLWTSVARVVRASFNSLRERRVRRSRARRRRLGSADHRRTSASERDRRDHRPPRR
ncbi:MAG: ABC transporter permease [Gaiellaceae bacterium]